MDVLVSGSTGLIGSAAVGALEVSGHRVVRLVRPATRGTHPQPAVRWDPEAGDVDGDGLAAVVSPPWAVVHMAGGEQVGAGRWTARRKEAIRTSRLTATRVVSEAVADLDEPPVALLSASAIGYYGDAGDEELTEDDGPGLGFLADLVRDWEEATDPAKDAGIRTVYLRTGLVLSRDGGLLPRLLLPFRLGLGGRLGSGAQWMSWISMADEVGAIVRLLEADVSGPVNLTAPHPVTNREFAKTLARVLRRPALVRVPVFVLRARFGGEMVGEAALASQRVLPERLLAAGYEFGDPELEPALRAVLGR